MVKIDVIIPSFRLTAETLLPILNLTRPVDAQIKFYLIADNPAVIPSPSITRLVDNKTIFLTINKVNQGASATRNIGIESGQGDWILFLDDDIEVLPDLLIVYANAIQQYPNEIGFIGVVNLPPATTPFANAINANRSMDMFTIAKKKASFGWGVTANFMISRKAIGEIRFSEIYPKAGGGEDVEFFIRVRALNNFKDYKCLSDATVTHPWWGDGRPDFKRFYRYGKGASLLTKRNTLYRGYDFLNTIETIFVSAIVFLLFLFIDFKSGHWVLFLYFIALTLVLEYLICLIIVLRRNKSFSPLTALYVMFLRSSNDTGVLLKNISRLRIVGLGERFHFHESAKKSNFVLNTNKIIKLIIYLLAISYAIYKL
ncbi:glycosyltransferase [Mucilaginibacter sp.]|uniref:glycosyltransferase family 2 protein n=1 Tax=Mucilaginibacter sp. TaxID=1882438 RepID=UPI00261126FB|nr:glycosyltransferase [Mucilaginibacter sp.]MDB4922635.1 hypothetical protein [Mucilaginibacter sp.]